MATLRPTIRFCEKKFVLPGPCFFLLLGSALFSFNLEAASAISLVGETTLVLYEAASGAVPGAPLMNFADFPRGTAQPAYSDGSTLLDTTTTGLEPFAGWTSGGTTTPGFPLLDRAAGFQVDFTLQVESEVHSRKNRSGFSLIVLGQDARGIELSFWQDQIWAKSDDATGGLFQHGEGVAFPTTSDMIAYHLAIQEDTYTLTANAQPILSGPVRDYSGFEGFPDPYETPNFLFLGDDSTSAQARVRLGFVSITGMEPASPTSTSTSSPLPAASPAPLPIATPVPSPARSPKMVELCPSGGVFFALVIAIGLILKRWGQG